MGSAAQNHPMFRIEEYYAGDCRLQRRSERLTGLHCRIAPDRLKRGIDLPAKLPSTRRGCPFCPDAVFTATTTFPDGSRILRGESVTFPNRFPFSRWHTVTVITHKHSVHTFTQDQMENALSAQVQSLIGHTGYPSINCNYLFTAGATLAHPHLQGIVDPRPTTLLERFLRGSRQYFRRTGSVYWDDLVEHERAAGRFLFGNEIPWIASAVPLGEREVRGILPVATLDEVEPLIPRLAADLLQVMAVYASQGTRAFNFSIFFDRSRSRGEFRAFCSMIARISPNALSISDSAFMERIHLEPVVLTLPEDLARTFRRIPD
ncbi:MAG: galactose-1-phosphate uridylyltransferase [Methanomicrobiales archaeon]|nr:galactose-1-phosphate uridylyltransferase [Methanomicrobiales archaeon]